MSCTTPWMLTALLVLASLGYAQEAPEGREQGISDDVVEKVDRSVVAIQHERAGGSGFIVSADGYILTNGHVVRGSDSEDPTRPAESITVILNNEQKYAARVLGFSMDPDVALIKIEADHPLQPVEFADSTKAQVGQQCFAVGTPVGLKRTFTSGILSNVDRSDLNTSTRVFQTDAAINPGNSGGPLFDRNGRVLGINTYGRSGNNLGFTIPTHVVQVVREHIRKQGRFIRADLPVFMVTELYDELAATLGVTEGMLIPYVMAGSPAEEAGLREGDVLVAFDGEPRSAKTRAELLDFEWFMMTREPGQEVTLSVLRGRPGEERGRIDIKARLEEHQPLPKVGHHIGEIIERRYEALGLGFKPITRLHRILFRLGDEEGVLLTSVSATAPAGKADIKDGDLLTAVDGTPTPDVASFEQALEKALREGRKYIELSRVRGKSTLPTVIAPYYYLKDRTVALIVPDPGVEHLDLLQRELIADGANLLIAYPDFVERPEGAVSVASLKGEEIDILLLAGGEGGRRLWTDEETLRVIREVHAAEGLLSAVGPSTLALVIAEPELLDLKITTSKKDSTEAMQRQANYTGQEVESEERMITTTGFDRAAYRKFLTALLRIARNQIRDEGDEG